MTDSHHHRHPQYLVKDRQEGKTTFLLDWLREGHQIEGMVAWSRVLIVRTIAVKREMLGRYGFDHRQIVSRMEIGQMRSGYDLSRTEFAIDDAEDLILDTFPHPAIWRQTRFVAITGAVDLMELEMLEWVMAHPDKVEARRDELQRQVHGAPPESLVDTEGQVTAEQYPEASPLVAPRVPRAKASKRPTTKVEQKA